MEEVIRLHSHASCSVTLWLNALGQGGLLLALKKQAHGHSVRGTWEGHEEEAAGAWLPHSRLQVIFLGRLEGPSLSIYLMLVYRKRPLPAHHPELQEESDLEDLLFCCIPPPSVLSPSTPQERESPRPCSRVLSLCQSPAVSRALWVSLLLPWRKWPRGSI